MPEKLAGFSGGVPGKGIVVAAKRPNSSLGSLADVRDSMAQLIGGGYTGLTDRDAQANYSRIANILGAKKAQDLATHIFIQNRRPELQSLKPEQRISRFYDIRSSHIPTDEVLQSVKSFGTGVVPGYQSSVNLINQQQQGNALGPSFINSVAKSK